MKKLAALAIYVMASCTPEVQSPSVSRAANVVQTLPPMKAFERNVAAAPARSNRDIAEDFLDLSFRMESGVEIPAMTRFEGPITVRVVGSAPATLRDDLQALVLRLQNEAGIPITITSNPNANITIEAMPQSQLQSEVPRAACFVVPRISNWDEFLKYRNTDRVNWTKLTKRDEAVIFVPSNVAPQEIRDCLHEELAQAIGPLNDLYRLPDSVFNDDNFHAVLTGLDMLLLRAYYAPELANGMTRQQAAARLPDVLARLNPRGNVGGTTETNNISRSWINALELALAGDVSPMRRRNAALQAISLGRSLGWTGPREGFAYYAHGRLQVGRDPDAALNAFNAAEAVYSRNATTQIHIAHIAVQKSAFALAAGDAQATLALVENAIPIAESHQNAALLATLMMFKAEALDMVGNTVAAKQVRLDSLGWARYGFGSEQNVTARLAEIAALRPF